MPGIEAKNVNNYNSYHLLSTEYVSDTLNEFSLKNSQQLSTDGYYYLLNFANEQKDAQRLNNLLTVTSGRSKTLK